MDLEEIPQISKIKVDKSLLDFHKKNPVARVPSVWGTNPIFAATEQYEPREIALSDGTMWTLGIPAPHRPEDSKAYQRALDVRHAEVIFSLISFYRTNGLDYNFQINISYNQLLQLVGWPKSDKNLKKLKKILGDLENIWTEINNGEKLIQFKILSSISLEKDIKTQSQRLRFLEFDRTFMEFIEAIEKMQNIQLDVFSSMRSDIAKSLYLYLPSRAVKNSIKNPFKITLTKVLEQIGKKVPKHKSSRKKIFEQNKNSVLNQLDHARLQFNTKLRVRIEETKDKKDFNLCSWSEELTDKDVVRESDSKLMTWYISGSENKTAEDFFNKVKLLPELEQYEIDRLQHANINVKQNEKFLKMAKAVLGKFEFDEIISTVKDAVLSGNGGIRNPMFYLIGQVRRNLTGDMFME